MGAERVYKKGLGLLLPVCLFLMVISPPFVGKASAGPVRFYPSDDADAGSGNWNMMGSGRSFIKFDFSSLPPGTTISSASLHLRVGGSPHELLYDGASGRYYLITWPRSSATCSVYEVGDDSWSESTITSGNQPACGDLIGNYSIDSGAGQPLWTDWDVTSWVQSQISGDGTVSLCMIYPHGILFASKELRDIGGPEDPRPYLEVLVEITNRRPNTPSRPSGPSSGYVNTSYTYSTSATDPDGDRVQYRFYWGDGSVSDWTELVSSGSSASKSHSWSSPGTYYVNAEAKDEPGATSELSSSRAVTISNPPPDPDFSISVSPTSGTINRGGSTTATITVTSINGYSLNVGLSTPTTQVEVSFNPTNGTPTFSSTMTITDSRFVGPGTADIWIYGIGADGKNRVCSYTLTIVNRPPNAPSTPSGPTSGCPGTSYTYSTSATDPEGDSVKYYFDWGDGTGSWTDWVSSGSSASKSHSWSSSGTYYMKTKSRDTWGAESGWSDNLKVRMDRPDDDGDPREVGVWALNDIPPNLPWSIANAQGFYDVLVGQGYTGRFTCYNQANVWEAQFEKPGWPCFGEDYNYVDSCDIIYFDDHGDEGELIVGWNGYWYDRVELTETVEWGDVDMEWAFLHCCLALKNSLCIPNGGIMAGAFDTKLHGMCGFNTIAYNKNDEGQYFAQYATGLMPGYPGPHSIGDSWVWASKSCQPDNVWGAWLSGSTTDYLTVFADDDYMPGFGSGMLPDPNYSNGQWCWLYYTWSCVWP